MGCEMGSGVLFYIFCPDDHISSNHLWRKLFGTRASWRSEWMLAPYASYAGEWLVAHIFPPRDTHPPYPDALRRASCTRDFPSVVQFG